MYVCFFLNYMYRCIESNQLIKIRIKKVSLNVLPGVATTKINLAFLNLVIHNYAIRRVFLLILLYSLILLIIFLLKN